MNPWKMHICATLVQQGAAEVLGASATPRGVAAPESPRDAERGRGANPEPPCCWGKVGGWPWALVLVWLFFLKLGAAC